MPLFRKGHIPIIGEWVALPLLHLAGYKKIGDSIWDEIQYPVAHRLLEKCDAVLRLEGASKGADEDVRIAKERGLKFSIAWMKFQWLRNLYRSAILFYT